ncbi:TetR/AcrR family transcriptional regulator [Roseburia hominis]
MPKKTFFNLSESKRNHIIDVAMDEFAKAPYQNISINHLIKCIGIPTGSFYQYFEDKKDLYFYIVSFYMDNELRERTEKNQKFDPMEPEEIEKAEKADAIDLESTQRMKYYKEIMVDSFNMAPKDIKRDWTFDRLIGGKYMGLYDSSFFENEQLDERIKENKELMIAITLAMTNVIHCFGDNDVNKEWELYKLCIGIFKQGLLDYKR